VLYATAANERAFDGSGRNSPFAKHMLAISGARDSHRAAHQGHQPRVQDQTSARGAPADAIQLWIVHGEFCFAGVPFRCRPLAARLKSRKRKWSD